MLNRTEFHHGALCALIVLSACSCEDASRSTPTEQAPVSGAKRSKQDSVAVPATPDPPKQQVPDSRWALTGAYVADHGRHCGGFPSLALSTPPKVCVGLVAHKQHAFISKLKGRFRPRSIVQDPTRDDVFWLVDAGARRSNAGRVLRLSVVGNSVKVVTSFSKLNRPHGSRVGPDGWIYVGLVDSIVKFDPRMPELLVPVTPQLPTNRVSGNKKNRERLRMHPMRAFVFTKNFDLLVNMGSSSDRCSDSLPNDRCGEEKEHVAALWLFKYLGSGRWDSKPEYFAHGLRNSMALAVHSSGSILQAENGSDFSEVGRPHEELNIIQRGGHYGWPYCYDIYQRDPKWTHSSFDCSNDEYTKPHLLLPPHGAPLGMAYYERSALPALQNSLLIPLHGYREPGHRLLAFTNLSKEGIPSGKPIEVISDWNKKPSALPDIDNPRGAPVDLVVARDGSIWLVEDKNGTILRIARDQFPARQTVVAQRSDLGIVAGPAFQTAHQKVLRTRCAKCHTFITENAARTLKAITDEGWLEVADGQSRIEIALGNGAPRPMPPDGPLTPAERRVMNHWLKKQSDASKH